MKDGSRSYSKIDCAKACFDKLRKAWATDTATITLLNTK